MKVETVKVDIASLRSQLVALMKEGFTEIPLTDLLHIIKEACISKGD